MMANVRFDTTCLATIAKGGSMPGFRLYDCLYEVVRAGVRQGAMEGFAESFAAVGVWRRYGD
ncbi:hypothetical protein [Paraburkholderia phytofirmans]|nr:hypothetical protein [Paraburkholderia phytofirmans]